MLGRIRRALELLAKATPTAAVPQALVQCTHRYANGSSAWTACGYNAALGAWVTTCRRCGKRATC